MNLLAHTSLSEHPHVRQNFVVEDKDVQELPKFFKERLLPHGVWMPMSTTSPANLPLWLRQVVVRMP